MGTGTARCPYRERLVEPARAPGVLVKPSPCPTESAELLISLRPRLITASRTQQFSDEQARCGPAFPSVSVATWRRWTTPARHGGRGAPATERAATPASAVVLRPEGRLPGADPAHLEPRPVVVYDGSRGHVGRRCRACTDRRGHRQLGRGPLTPSVPVVMSPGADLYATRPVAAVSTSSSVRGGVRTSVIRSPPPGCPIPPLEPRHLLRDGSRDSTGDQRQPK
jgi:hypothetical protein